MINKEPNRLHPRVNQWSNNPVLEVRGIGGAFVWDPVQKALETIIGDATHAHILPHALYQGSQHIGDLGDTYLFSALTDLAISQVFPTAPRTIRRVAGVTVGTVAGFVAEVPKLNEFASHFIPSGLLGTPDFPADIWFALLGPALWLGLNIYANRAQKNELK